MKRKDIYDLTDRVIVITGGLGQIGSQFTLELVDRGAKVAIFNHRIPDGNTLKERFPVDSGRLKFFQVDITKKDSVKAGLDALVAQWGVPHVLVNNAGIDTQPSAPPEVSGPFEDFPENIWRKASPMKVSKSSVVTRTTKVDSDIHQASMLFLPCESNSPKEGVPGGTPRPKKSREVSAKIAALMRKGKKVTTGVMLLGSTWRVMICQLLRPMARAART